MLLCIRSIDDYFIRINGDIPIVGIQCRTSQFAFRTIFTANGTNVCRIP